MPVLIHALVESDAYRRKQRNLTRDFKIPTVIHDLLGPALLTGAGVLHAGAVSRG